MIIRTAIWIGLLCSMSCCGMSMDDRLSKYGAESITYADVTTECTAGGHLSNDWSLYLRVDPVLEVLTENGWILHTSGRLTIGASQGEKDTDGTAVTAGACFAGLDTPFFLPLTLRGGRLNLPDNLPPELFGNTSGHEWLMDGGLCTIDYSPWRLDIFGAHMTDTWIESTLQEVVWSSITHTDLRAALFDTTLFGGTTQTAAGDHPVYLGGRLNYRLGEQWTAQWIGTGQSGSSAGPHETFRAGMTVMALHFDGSTSPRRARAELAWRLYGGDITVDGKHDFIPLLPGYAFDDIFHPLQSNIHILHLEWSQIIASAFRWEISGELYAQHHSRKCVVSTSIDSHDATWLADGDDSLLGYQLKTGIVKEWTNYRLHGAASLFLPAGGLQENNDHPWLVSIQCIRSY